MFFFYSPLNAIHLRNKLDQDKINVFFHNFSFLKAQRTLQFANTTVTR